MSEQRNELHHLINSLPDEQVREVLADVQRRTRPRATPPESAFAWVGMGPARNERHSRADD